MDNKTELASSSKRVLIDQWLLSRPSDVIRASKQATPYSLACVLGVPELKTAAPLRYAMLAAEAIAQGFPLS